MDQSLPILYFSIVKIPTRDIPARDFMSTASFALFPVPSLAILSVERIHANAMLGNSEDVIILPLPLSLVCP